MKSLCYVLIGIVISIFSPSYAWAAADSNPDPNATVVYLRKNCDVLNSNAGESPIENCFEITNSLRTWIYSRPNPSNKLLIDIGPGTFARFSCIPSITPGGIGGDLTFRGAGVDKTILTGVSHLECLGSKWAFENMTIRDTGNTVVWHGGGDSVWTNVVIEGFSASTWYDLAGADINIPCELGNQGTHRFFSSRIVGHSTSFSFLNACGDDWLWGSEIVFAPPPGTSVGSALRSFGLGNKVHLYGSNIRVEVHPNAGATGSLTAINVSDGAEVHSHGVGLDVIAKPGWTATALDASNGGQIHANESSYFFGNDVTGITVKRIVNNNGHVHAPFLWAAHPTPPAIQSTVGADIAVVTSGTSDSRPHMVIYVDSATCSSNWYDTTDKDCWAP